MRQRVKVLILTLVVALSVLGGGALAADTTPPTIGHTGVSTAFSSANLILSARVSDNSVLERVTLFFRMKGTSSYYAMDMNVVLGEYRAAIPAFYLKPGYIEYYIEAVDISGNTATWPIIAAAKRPQIIAVEPDTTAPQAILMLPKGTMPGQGFVAVIALSDQANNVDLARTRVKVNGKDLTSNAQIASNRVTVNVPAELIGTRSVLEVEVHDLAGNQTVRRFSLWEQVAWSRELRVDFAQEKQAKASFDTAFSWGPLSLSANIRSDDPSFTHISGQPSSTYSFKFDARNLKVGLGDISSEQSPLAMSSLRHRGADITLKLGPIVTQAVYGFPQVYVAGKDYERKAVGARFAFDSRFLDLSANVVKIKDQWNEAVGAEIHGANPELNYVFDAQAGIAMFGEKLSLLLEMAASLYFENARGDLWPILDALKADYENQDEMLKQLIDIADRVPQPLREFLELPNPPLPFKLDAGAQATLQVPLPWSNLAVRGFHFGPSYYTMSGSGDRDVDGAQVKFSTSRWFNFLQFSADYEQRLDNAMSLLGYLLEAEQGERNLTTSYGGKVSLGKAGRLNLDLTGTYREKGPELAAQPERLTQGYSAALRNLRLNLLGMGMRLGGAYSNMDELHPADSSADKNTVTYNANVGLDVGGVSLDLGYVSKEEQDVNGAVTATSPSVDSSFAWTLQHPRFLFVTLHEVRLKAAAGLSWSEQPGGAKADTITTLKGDVETRLTSGLQLGAAWKSTKEENQEPNVSLTGLLRWRF